MLGMSPYYNRTLRKIIAAFGAIFNGIEIIKFDYTTTPATELQRVTVPIKYEGKEDWLTRLYEDPDATRGVQVSLPSITWHMTNLRYRQDRRQSPFKAAILTESGNTATQVYNAAPYDIFFELYIYVRNMEDGYQIIEQILPVFSPEYSVTLKYVVDGNNFISQDLPFVLENVEYSNQYEGASGSVRIITWTLQFSAKAYFYGPQPSTAIIDESIINLRTADTGSNSNIAATITTTVNPIGANVTDSWTANTTITETD